MTPDSAEAALEAIVRLDILPRLIGTDPDPAAGALATELIASGQDKNLSPPLRSLAFIPLLHSDRPIDRERAVALFAGLRRETGETVFERAYDAAVRQRDASSDPLTGAPRSGRCP